MEQNPLLPFGYTKSRTDDDNALCVSPRSRETIDQNAGGTRFHTRESPLRTTTRPKGKSPRKSPFKRPKRKRSNDFGARTLSHFDNVPKVSQKGVLDNGKLSVLESDLTDTDIDVDTKLMPAFEKSFKRHKKDKYITDDSSNLESNEEQDDGADSSSDTDCNTTTQRNCSLFPNTSVPNYNASNLSRTLLKKQEPFHISSSSMLSSDNLLFEASSDIPFETEHDDTDEAQEIEDYITKERLMDTRRKSCESDGEGDETAEFDLERTPVFSRTGSRTQSSRTSIFHSNSVNRVAGKVLFQNAEYNSSSEVAFKLDSLGRITNTATVDSDWSMDEQDTSYQSIFTAKTKSKTAQKTRSFSRTNSLNIDKGDTIAKEVISNAIDNGDSIIEVENLSLRRIPDEIEDLTKLVCVDNNTEMIKEPDLQVFFSNNKLTEINPRIFSLENLTVLSVRSNRISEIPGKIKNCAKLNYLQLSGNKLKYLPFEILLLRNLETLTIKPNPLLIEFSEYCKNHTVWEVNPYINSWGTWRYNDSAKKRYSGELIFKNTSKKLKLPSLSQFALRKFESYHLSMKEIKDWSQTLSKNQLHSLNVCLLKLGNGNSCYNCTRVLLTDPEASIIEFWDICGQKLVPIQKQFCCAKCAEQFQTKELNKERVKRFTN